MGAREGRGVAELMGTGSTLLTSDDVLPGVAELTPKLQIEGMFPDGAKMITVHQPIRPGTTPLDPAEVTAGEIITPDGEIELNSGRTKLSLRVVNTGDRPIQVGSHFHFFEANKALDFDRAAAFGKRLDVPAGVSKRFEPGESKQVELVAFGGTGEITGFSSLTNGSIYSAEVKAAALERARAAGFKGA